MAQDATDTSLARRLFVAIVKRFIGRVRPSSAGPFAYEPFHWRPDFASLPSGHTTTAFATYRNYGQVMNFDTLTGGSPEYVSNGFGLLTSDPNGFALSNTYSSAAQAKSSSDSFTLEAVKPDGTPNVRAGRADRSHPVFGRRPE